MAKRHTERRLIALLLVATACTQTPAVSTSTSVPLTPSTTASVASQVFELAEQVSHPNGAQLRVDRVELLTDSTVVTATITNGSPFELLIGGGTTELRPDSGPAIALLDGLDSVSVAPSGDIVLNLRFGPVQESPAVTLALDEGGGSSPTSPETNRPSFLLGPIRLDTAQTRPGLPSPVPLRRSTTDTAGSGIELTVEGITFTENRIGLWARISNPTAFEARIAPSIAPSLIEDDVGNRYPLVLPEGQGWISIPAGEARSGALVFAGRLHPRAVTLNLALNGATPTHFYQNRVYPELILTDIPVTGDTAAAPLPEIVAPEATIDHPAGTTITLHQVSFTDSTINAAVTIDNTRADEVQLAATATHMADSNAAQHPLVPLPDNPTIAVDPATTVEATLAFAGRISDIATAVTLVFNPGRSADDPQTVEPGFTFGPYPLQRTSDTVEPLTAPVFAVTTHSHLAPDELAVSQVDRITQTLIQFNATPVTGGFRLTLPDSILYDFASSELRPDARQSLALIAEVIEYFEQDPVVVVGHTDSIGSPSGNQTLSEQRAQAVVDSLVQEHTVPAERLTAEGRGAGEPVAPNTNPDGTDNPEGRQLNRRVEIVVLTDKPLPTQ